MKSSRPDDNNKQIVGLAPGILLEMSSFPPVGVQNDHQQSNHRPVRLCFNLLSILLTTHVFLTPPVVTSAYPGIFMGVGVTRGI